jgi:hypothetical protein
VTDLDNKQIKRQNDVDNAIQNLMVELSGKETLRWDIQQLANVRMALAEAIYALTVADTLQIFSQFEIEFYPWVDEMDTSEFNPDDYFDC